MPALNHPINKNTLAIINKAADQFSEAREKGLNLYTVTWRFNSLKYFKSGEEGERRAEERVLFWFKGVLKRLYNRPWREDLFAWVFFDTEGLSGPHAHGLIAISDEGYRDRYKGKSFNQCFEGDEYGRWLIPPDSRGNREVLKSYWVDRWDGGNGLLKYSAKGYEWGGAFWGGNPLYISGELCTPLHIRERRRLTEILTGDNF